MGPGRLTTVEPLSVRRVARRRSAAEADSGRRRMTAEQRSLRGRMAAAIGHSRHDPRVTTVKARQAFLARYEREVDPDGRLPARERRQPRRAVAQRRPSIAWRWRPPGLGTKSTDAFRAPFGCPNHALAQPDCYALQNTCRPLLAVSRT
jgi:hypothetical protein